MGFIHLHNHSEYSMLDSAAKVTNLVRKAKEQNMPALAITDHGNMHGAMAFYEACKSNGIKPIIGCEFYLTNHLDVRDKSIPRYHLILLAKNNTGYHNLCRLVSESSKHFYFRPLIDKNLLRQYREGLLCMSACVAGEVNRNLADGKDDEAKKAALEYIDIFGKDDFYIEVQDHGLPDEAIALPKLFSLAKELGLKTVATNDIHYVEWEDSKAQDILLCIRTNAKLSDEKRFTFSAKEFYFKTEKEMYELFHNQDNCITNTEEIAAKCNVEIKTGLDLAPHFPRLPEGFTETSYLRSICEENITKKYPPEKIEQARERMEYELSVIEKMNYSGYFLIVWDFIRYARENGIAIGPGRGSAVGSVVCYLTGITMLEPMQYNLLFERFLNPERVSMPDIDSDIADEDRKKIVEYMVETYGENNSAQIVTYSRSNAKGAIRDVTRVLGESYSFGDKLVKLIPANDPHMTISKALEMSQELANIYSSDPTAKKIIDFAKKIEGLPRQDGTHAAGLVICKENLADIIPMTSQTDGLHTQFDKDEVERIGLLKMDLLGLKNLSVMTNTMKVIKKNGGPDIDINAIPLDDEAALSMLCKGDTFGVFQLESKGITDIVTKIAPKHFRDLIPIVALYRPGPLGSGMVEDFIRCCRGEKEIEYVHPSLEPVLKETYGVMLYQEQVMQAVQVMANFSLGKADIVRRAMGKKKSNILEELKGEFVKGCLTNGIDEVTAERVFALMMNFANYGFNKSHSAAYGYIAYQTAYLKAHYPKEYMAAYMNAYISRPDKIRKALEYCQSHGIKVLHPDITKSTEKFTATPDGILFGLCGIKGIGDKVAAMILEERAKKPFCNTTDLLLRVAIAKSDFECLCFSGAIDSLWNGDSGVLWTERNEIFEAAKTLKKSRDKEKDSGMESLFGEEVVVTPDIPELLNRQPKARKRSLSQILKNENAVLGYYITSHPLDGVKETLAKTIDLGKFLREHSNEELEQGIDVNLCGLLENVKYYQTKDNKTMVFFTVSYYSDRIGGVLFPKDYINLIYDNHEWISKALSKDIVVITGRITLRNGEPQIIARTIKGKNIGDGMVESKPKD